MIFDSSDDEDQEIYAVKVVRSQEEEVLIASEKEFEIIKDLNHENLSKGYEMFKDDMKKETFQVIKLVNGVELLD